MTRTVILLSLVVILFSNLSRADATPPLPSRKASVVIPLLEKIKTGDGFPKVKEILGDPTAGESGAGQSQFYYALDSGATVCVSIWAMPGHGDGLISVGLREPNKGIKPIYPKPTN